MKKRRLNPGSKRLPKVVKTRILSAERLESREMFDRTTGLMLNTGESFPGYTLFAPSTTTTTYLIDENGQKVHSWESNWQPMTAELMPNGDLVRAGRLPANPKIHSTGSAGIIERFNWEGKRTWYYKLDNSRYRSHHDFEVLPNGNVLLIAWEYHTKEDAIRHGRDANAIEDGFLLPETIFEIKPSPGHGGTVVWQWRMWDHMLQNRSPRKANYLSPAKHPELIDINYRRRGVGQEGTPADWAHMNAIDYDPKADQIILSPREFSELWVIDHSTTTEQARGSTGGKQGKGGDLLYRWGNPAAWKQGTFDDQVLSYQHDTTIIKDGLPGAGNYLVFNNGWTRPDGNYSSVDEIKPPVEHQWLLNNLNSGTDLRFLWSFDTGEVPKNWIPLAGDWNGSGNDNPGLYDPVTNIWYLNNRSDGSTDQVVKVEGWDVPNTWRPVTGDWDGDGRDSIGFYDPANKTWHLNNKIDGSVTDVLDVQTPGTPDNGLPLAGDWDGDHKDTPGFYGTFTHKWYFTNGVSATETFTLIIDGKAVAANFRPFVGDWDNDGDDSPGIWDPSTNRFFYTNQLVDPTTGASYRGDPLPRKYLPIAGNWDGKQGDTMGLYNTGFKYGTFLRAPGKDFGPDRLTRKYTRPGFFAAIISGAQRLPNGNTLICEGTEGRFFEVTPAGKVVWEYVNPATSQGILAWNDPIPPAGGGLGGIADLNLTFRAYRYGLNYSAFDGRDLSPKGLIERFPQGEPTEAQPQSAAAPVFSEENTKSINSASDSAVSDAALALLLASNPEVDQASISPKKTESTYVANSQEIARETAVDETISDLWPS